MSHDSSLTPPNLETHAESLVAAEVLLGQALTTEIETNRACLARLTSFEAEPAIDTSYESFVLGEDYERIVEGSIDILSQGHARIVPRRRENLGHQKTRSVGTETMDRLAEFSRDAGPSLVLMFETGLGKCRQDLETAGTHFSQASEALAEVPDDTAITDLPADQRAVLIETLAGASEQIGQGGTLLPCRASLGDLEQVLLSEGNTILNEVITRLPPRMSRQLAGLTGRMQKSGSPVAEITGNNLVGQTVRRVYARAPDIQRDFRSPEELADANNELSATQKQIAQQRLEGNKSYDKVVELHRNWSNQLALSLSDLVVSADANIASAEELLAETTQEPERAVLETQLAHTRNYVEALRSELHEIMGGLGLNTDQLAAQQKDDAPATDVPQTIVTPSAGTEASEGQANEPEAAVLHPALVSALRTARQVFKGGGKIVADRTMNDKARQLFTLSVETKRGDSRRVLEPHECGMVIAVLAGRHESFLDLVYQVQQSSREQPLPEIRAARSEWTAEIFMLLKFDADQTIARLQQVLSDSQLLQKLMGVLSSREIERLRNFVDPQREDLPRTAGRVAVQAQGQRVLVPSA